MSLDLFEKINKELSSITNELAYHVVGDPLILSNLGDYLNISKEQNLKVNITTTANNFNSSMFDSLMNTTIKQVNFSINSYNANSHKKSLKEYLSPIFEYIQYANNKKQNHFINLRIWNLDESKSAKEFNFEVFNYANEFFNCDIAIEDIYSNKPKNIRIAPKVFFNFDDYFVWPSLDNEVVSQKGFCYGLDSHFGVLSSGKVVPCCLDKDGVINLGDLSTDSLENILKTKRVLDIQKGFKNKEVIEELCQKCSYRTRFD